MGTQHGFKVDLNQLPIRKCPKCNSETYTPIFQLRWCSALLSPVGKAGMIFVQIGFACTACTSPVAMNETPPEEPKQNVVKLTSKEER